jgi:serine/threonine-protein kinase
VTGEVPFSGKSPVEIVEKKGLGEFPPASTLNPDVPPELDRILNKMMARHARDRYQLASDLIIELERSQLAAPVPSFVAMEQALRDPLMRARLTTPNQPTMPDLRLETNGAKEGPGRPDVWYLRYQDQEGRWCKARGTTQQILDRVRTGQIPAGAEVSHEPQGEFRPLATFPEFRSFRSPR